MTNTTNKKTRDQEIKKGKRAFLNNDVVFLKGQAMFVLFWVPVVLLSDLETFLVK